MFSPIVLDLETKFSFAEVAHDHKKLGISMVGIYRYDTGEYEAYFEKDLPRLFPLLESASVIVGFNIKKFDCVVLSSYYVGNLLSLPILDLLDDVEKHMGYRLSLDDLGRETLRAKKNGHGLQAIEYFRSGELEKLKNYCFSDVKITRDLYEFGKRTNVVYFKDVRGRKEIPVDWKATIHSNDIPLTLPL